jgi:hypothetical protein
VNLYVPPDVNEAHQRWMANCGPSAVAALFARPLSAVRDAFPWFPERPRCSPTQLLEAVTTLVGDVGKLVSYGPARGDVSVQVPRFPPRGLVVVQIDGPWVDLADKRIAYTYTHTVAVRETAGVIWVYDINGGSVEHPGGWLPLPFWSRDVMRLLVEEKKRATGWFVKAAIDLALPRASKIYRR